MKVSYLRAEFNEVIYETFPFVIRIDTFVLLVSVFYVKYDR